MKQVIAYVKNHKLPEIALALQEIEGLTGMSVAAAHGFGRGRAKNAKNKVVRDLVNFMHMDRIEIFCGNEIVEQIVDTILATAHEGLKGDGKIYVCDVCEAVRIGTKERGNAAV